MQKPFWHPDDPIHGNCLPPMTDQEWKALEADHQEKIARSMKHDLLVHGRFIFEEFV